VIGCWVCRHLESPGQPICASSRRCRRVPTPRHRPRRARVGARRGTVRPAVERHVDRLGAGYGGGSLVYANVQMRPLADLFDGWTSPYSGPALDPYYDLVAHMLDITQVHPSPPDDRSPRKLEGRTSRARDLPSLRHIARRGRGSGHRGEDAVSVGAATARSDSDDDEQQRQPMRPQSRAAGSFTGCWRRCRSH
jgi:hypothetical protein